MSDLKSSSLQVGSILGRYELLLPIAKGGMAQVWAARLRGTRGFQKLVAIKTILADVMDNTRMEQMFLEEATLASQIHHPNVVQTQELGEQEGTLYLAMEWVDGEPLSQVMARAAERGGLPLPIAVNLIAQACQGLQAAHDLRDESGERLGVVHRDVSPQNLLISYSGTAKLVDFGIAKVAARSTGLTQAGEVKGKFAYMAPEQVRGQVIDARTDLFSLGILLYSVTTGKHPFRGSHTGETLQNICSATPAGSIRAFLPDYPPELEAVVLKALQKQPDDRFSSAHELLAALDAAVPAALAPSFDAEVADYMGKLFGAKASERRAAIRNAQNEVDRQRHESPASSVGTLRAISISQDGSQISLTPTPGSSSAPRLVEAAPPPAPSRRLGIASVAGAAVVAIVAVFQLARGPAPAASSVASSPVPRDMATLEQLHPLASALPAAPSAAASAAPASSADDEATADVRSSKKATRANRVAGAAVKAPLAAATPGPVTAEATPAAAKPAPAPTTSVNAWDRGAFGGRH
ncbi:MAG: serine/threonine protein kinase [Myxococcales bacterium]|nr:MAG: serine/threonine protein kinase [Myxococcales bacterium]